MANSIHIGGGGSGSATLITKSITQNGTYNASSDNADGYSSVEVDVAGGAEYVDISDFAFYYRKNTGEPTVTKISDYEYSLTYRDQNASGYELSSYSVSLEKGVYVAEIKVTVDKNTGIDPRYTWGIYSCTTSGWATTNGNSPMDNAGIDTYVPFDTSDTAEHTYEVPINVTADGTAYICFATAADNGVNATITVSSLKIRKAYGSGEGGNYSDDLFDGTLIPNVYIDNNNGSVVSYNTWSATDFIDVSGISTIYFCSSATSAADRQYNAWYDSNKAFISNFWLSPFISVPANAKYMRMSAKTDNITGSKLFRSVE